METGAINRHDAPDAPRSESRTRQAMNATPCRAASRPLNALQFNGVNAVLDAGMMRELDRVAAVAKMCPTVRIEIHGHASDWSSAEVNQRLADARAQAAMAYLAASGVPVNRMAAIGHAGGGEAASDAAPADAAKTAIVRRVTDRRVEFKLRDPAHNAAALRVMWDLAELLDPAYVPAVADLSR
jgi:outer membrane protein OmpA-like peptidoglycan-associated protein